MVTLAAELSRDELLERLRAQAEAPARARAERLFPAPAALAKLLPEPGLKPGAAYCLDVAGSLLAALLAEPSRDGSWCGVVGVPEFGAEAAAAAGVSLDRLVLVPQPAEQWLAVAAALAEAVPVVAVRPYGRVSERDAARLASRLRDRGGVLLVHGEWPRAEASLRLVDIRWAGLGQGHGHLDRREVTVSVSSRRSPGGRRARLMLPSPDGKLAVAHSPVEATPPIAGQLGAAYPPIVGQLGAAHPPIAGRAGAQRRVETPPLRAVS